MKTLSITMLVVAFFFSCRSVNNLSKAEEIANLTEKVESDNYTFVPQTAYPMGGKAVNINYSYYLKVSKDTITSYLPYFGRAYTSLLPSEAGGITFVSTDFDYTVSDKVKGFWNAEIDVKSDRKRYKLILNIGESGYTTLTVQDNDRQSILFYGKIE